MRVFVAVRVPEGEVDRAVGLIVEEFSPNIEIADDGTVVFDLAGSQTERLGECLGRLQREFPEMSAGVSDNLASALLLVGERRGVNVAGKGGRGALANLGIESLGAGREFTELMLEWGIEDFDSFSHLPEDEMADRFGQEAVRLFRRVKGTEFRAASWNVKENEFRWSNSFDTEIRSVEPLKFIVSTGVRKIFEKLKRACLGTQECRISLRGCDGTCEHGVKTIVPTLNEKLWLRLINLKLESEPLGFYVTDIGIEFIPAKMRSIQSDLFSANVLEPEQIGLVASKVRKLVGDGNVGVPVPLDSWEPRAFALEDDLASLSHRHVADIPERIFPGRVFFYFPKPVRIKVFFDGSIPAMLVIKGKRHRVVASGGPWRVDGGWWGEGAWHRDEWDIETDAGSLFRMCLERDGEYYLEGGYD
jgi:protein ImuB